MVLLVMADDTDTDGHTGSVKGGTIVVAIIVPSVLIIVILVLIFLSVPRVLRYMVFAYLS